jgi:hypothetical protein
VGTKVGTQPFGPHGHARVDCRRALARTVGDWFPGYGHRRTYTSHRVSRHPRRASVGLCSRATPSTSGVAAPSAAFLTDRSPAGAPPASKPSPAPSRAAGSAANPAASGGAASVGLSTPSWIGRRARAAWEVTHHRRGRGRRTARLG